MSMAELQQPNVVGNFLSAYGTAQQNRQAQEAAAFNQQRAMRQDQRAEQQFDMEMDANQLKLAVGRAEAFDNILRKVRPGDDASLQQAKSEFVNTFGGDPNAVAGVTMDRVMELRAESDLKLKELRARIAATDRSNRPRPGGGVGGAGGVTVDPETGALVVTPGMSDMKLTEGQSKDIAFLNRASAANAKLDADRTAALVSSKNLGRNVPFVGNALQSSSSRQGGQIGKDFIAAVLRKDTGAAVTEQEFDFYSDIFLPQWGDDAASLALKEESRKSFLDGMRSGLSNGAALARMGVVPPPELAAPGGTQPSPAGGAGAPATTTPPPPPGFRISQ
jgi:hypothetical protein